MPLLTPRPLESLSREERRSILYRNFLSLDQIVERVVVPIYEEMLANNLGTLVKYNKKWDGFNAEPLVLGREKLKDSYDFFKKNKPTKIEAFEAAHKNIKDFHEQQKPRNLETTISQNTLGLLFRPFESVALYVPGGKALYPSTALMGVTPAKIAGVQDITIVSPPHPEGKSVPKIVQATAYLAGAHRIVQTGGAQGVLSMGIGIQELNLPPIDFIYGPGNKYVSAAKVFLNHQGLCGIDTFAGPSEVLIIADETANPSYLAHDLLAQAEHDEDAVAILLCTDGVIAQQVADVLVDAVENRNSDRKEITRSAIQKNGHIFLVNNLEEAIHFSNKFSPEHLEIQTKNDEEVLSKIQSAGSIFLGAHSPVAMGDYYSGTNHILPTNRAARFSSGVSTHTFFRRITYQRCSERGLEKAAEPISIMSKEEGLFDEHGYSVLVRL